MPEDRDDDRPRKSWSEIDMLRDKARRGDRRQAPSNVHGTRSHAYRAYKSQLHKLFDGGKLPEGLKKKLEDANVAPQARERQQALNTVLEAAQPHEIREAVTRFIDTFGFPEHEEVLGKLLDLADKAWVLRALETLNKLRGQGPLKRAASLKARIKTAQMTLDDRDVNQAADALLAKL